MFNFDEDKLTDEQIMNAAAANNVPPLKLAINANGYKGSSHFWCEAEELFFIKLELKQGVVVSVMHQLSRGKGVVNVTSLCTAAKKIQPFVGRDGVMFDLNKIIIPWLEYAGAVCRVGDKIYLNPYLVSVDEVDIHKWCNAWREEESKAQGKLQASSDLIHGYDADEVRKAIEFYRKAKTLLKGEY